MRIRWLACILAAAALSATLAEPVLAQGKGRGRSQDAKAGPAPTATVAVQFGFGPRDREIITRYYGPAPSGLPPGLARRDGLPPGLEKQLRRNGRLPPGLQKKLEPFPVALERQLPPLPRGYRRGIIGPHLVVYRPGTYVIVDVMLDVAR